MRAATGILIYQVGNYQSLKDDDVPCCLYISRGLNNVTYEVHTFILEGSSRLTLGEISPHRCNTRILYLPTSLYLISFSFSSDLSNRLFQGSFPSVFVPLHMSNTSNMSFSVAQKPNLRLGHPIPEVPRSHTIRQTRARGGRWGPYLNNTQHRIKTFTPSAEFEATIPAIWPLKTYAFYRMVTEIGFYSALLRVI